MVHLIIYSILDLIIYEHQSGIIFSCMYETLHCIGITKYSLLFSHVKKHGGRQSGLVYQLYDVIGHGSQQVARLHLFSFYPQPVAVS